MSAVAIQMIGVLLMGLIPMVICVKYEEKIEKVKTHQHDTPCGKVVNNSCVTIKDEGAE